MAKTESTAVNELIELVAGEAREPRDAPERHDDELMFRSPAPAPVKVSVPRMSTLPPMRGAAEVPPLPRTRAPNGTQRNPAVRVSTAPPSRAASIPPLPRTRPSPTAPPPVPPMRASHPQIALPPPPPSRPSNPSNPTIDAHVPIAAPPLPPAPRESADSMPTVDARIPIEAFTPPAASSSTDLPVATRATRPSLPPPIRASSPRTLAPASMPVAAPFRTPVERKPFPVSPAMPAAHAYGKPDMTSDQPWFEDSRRHPTAETAPVRDRDDESWVGTVHVPKAAAPRTLLGKLALPAVGLAIVGVFVGGYVVFDGEGKHAARTPATATPATATPAAASPGPLAGAEPVQVAPTPSAATAETPAITAPTTPEAPTTMATTTPVTAKPAAASTLVDVRIDSKPEGATVMLVDRGKTTFLGTTPVSAAVDATRTYDLVFTYANRPTQLEHLDPATSTRLAVTLGHGATAKPAVTATPAIATPAMAATPTATATPPRAPAVHKAVTEVAAAAHEPKATGEGTLMISTKPPCDIYVDGKPTGLTTPQRAIALGAGSHKITLVNTAESIKKTIAVTINADKPTKVIQDLMTK